MSLNICVLQGRLGSDPELKVTPNGTEVATVNLAVDRDYKNKDGGKDTDWFTIVAWRGTAKFLANYFTKGQQAVVHGKLQMRQYTTQNGEKRSVCEVLAENVYFAGEKAKAATGQNTPVSNDFVDVEVDDLGDLPF